MLAVIGVAALLITCSATWPPRFPDSPLVRRDVGVGDRVRGGGAVHDHRDGLVELQLEAQAPTEDRRTLDHRR